jgi:hypothetical protein
MTHYDFAKLENAEFDACIVRAGFEEACLRQNYLSPSTPR